MLTENHNHESEKVACIACKTSIAKGADLCVHCGSYQYSWMNTLKYISTVAGALAIAGALTVFAITKWPEVRKALFWKDSIRVLSYVPNGSIVVANLGDGEVFFTDVSLSTALDSSTTISSLTSIRRHLGAGKTINHDFHMPHDVAFPTHPAVIKGELSTKEEIRLIVRRALDFQDSCLGVRIKGPSKIQKLRSSTEALTILFSGELQYYSVEKGRSLVHKFEAMGEVYRRTRGSGLE